MVAQYNAIELIVKREQVSSEVRNRLQERAKDFFILLDDVSIVRYPPIPSFSQLFHDYFMYILLTDNDVR